MPGIISMAAARGSSGGQAAASTSSSGGGRGASIRAHSRFFDSLVQLVPPKYYLDTDADFVSHVFLKKSEKRALQQTIKAKRKHGKRAKLDPDAAQTTLELQRASAGKGNAGGADADAASPSGARAGGAGGAAAPAGEQGQAPLRLTIGNGVQPSREELRAKLQKRIEVRTPAPARPGDRCHPRCLHA